MFQVNPRATKADFTVLAIGLVAMVVFAVVAAVFFLSGKTTEAVSMVVPAFVFAFVSARGMNYVFKFGGK